MYYPDLTSAEEDKHYSAPDKNAFYVGWLEPSEEEPILGDTSLEFRNKITSLCSSGEFRYEAHRGFHICPFCRKSASSTTYLIPCEANIKTYYFPEMIAHYVNEHNYKPPEEFILAILALNFSKKNKSSSIHKLRGLSQGLKDG